MFTTIDNPYDISLCPTFSTGRGSGIEFIGGVFTYIRMQHPIRTHLGILNENWSMSVVDFVL